MHATPNVFEFRDYRAFLRAYYETGRKRGSGTMRLRSTFSSCVGIGAMLVSLACNGTSTGNPADDKNDGPTLDDFTADSFRLVGPGSPDCSVVQEPSAEKVLPDRAELEARLGSDPAEFIVLMKEEVSLDEYPLPGSNRDDSAWEEDPVYMARAQRVAESQACAIASLEEHGGTYVESFLLINAFVAVLTVPEAVQLSERSDVRSVELGETDTPPPM